jgi:hypothetical protein
MFDDRPNDGLRPVSFVKEIYTEAGKSSSAERLRMINASPRNGPTFIASAEWRAILRR